jgi:hypothetical protein
VKLIVERIDSVKPLVEANEGGEVSYYIEGIFLQADVQNRNGRIYPEKIMDKAVQQFVQEKILTNLAVGELNHPDSPRINYERASHKIVSLHKEGANYIGKAKILDTPVGNIVKALLKDNVQIGVSSRALGSLRANENGVDIVQEDLWLSTIDIVSDPSAPEAFVNGILECKEYLFENGILTETEAKKLKKTINAASLTMNEEKKNATYLKIFADILMGKHRMGKF